MAAAVVAEGVPSARAALGAEESYVGAAKAAEAAAATAEAEATTDAAADAAAFALPVDVPQEPPGSAEEWVETDETLDE